MRPMDFMEYLKARGEHRLSPMPQAPRDMTAPEFLFNPGALDGPALWVGLRMVPVSLVAYFIYMVTL